MFLPRNFILAEYDRSRHHLILVLFNIIQGGIYRASQIFREYLIFDIKENVMQCFLEQIKSLFNFSGSVVSA